MKKITAILLALVMILTCLATVACNSTVFVYLEDYNGPGTTKKQVYDPNEALPTPPDRADFKFGGWYVDYGCTIPFVNGTPMKDNFHLYAKWTPKAGGEEGNEIQITFVYCDGVTANKVVKTNSGLPFSSVLSTGPNPSRTNYRFDGWYTKETGGEQLLDTTILTVSMFVYAHWTYVGQEDSHTTHDFGDNYFMFVKCSGCDVYGRNESEGTFLVDFVYSFNDNTKATIDGIYSELADAFGNSISDNAFCELFDDLDAAIYYLQGQYYVASTVHDIEYSDESYAALSTISSYFYEMVEKYYGLFALVNESQYKDAFLEWNDWTQEDLDEAIAIGNSYSGSENQTKLDELLSDYYNLSSEISELEYYIEVYQNYGWDEEYADEFAEMQAELQTDYALLYATFGDFVNVNNKIAAEAGYGSENNQNYLDYAYKNDYNRAYSPAKVAEMRNLVKTYMGGIFKKVVNEVTNLKSGFTSYDDVDFANALLFYPLFPLTLEEYYEIWADDYNSIEDARSDWEEYYSEEFAQVSTNYIGNYFKWLNSNTAGKKEINFYKAANDVFKNGNFFAGMNDGAYTAWIPSMNNAIMYFGGQYSGNDYYYQSPFTFVHEFGHYYENVYSGGLSLSYDHDETQSQGNEMLFLAWLGQNKASGVDHGYSYIRAYQLLNILQTIIMSTAVDEFEQVAYSGESQYNGQDIPTVEDGIVNYTALYRMILLTYVDDESIVDDMMSTSYWQVAFDSPCYYISYGMSALVSLEIYMQAMEDGLDAARETYFKLFTFADNSDYVTTVTYGDGSSYSYLNNGVTYEMILNEWCGLKDAFDQSLYTDLQHYFNAQF